MNITHTHPRYPDEADRLAALRDAHRLCLTLLRRRQTAGDGKGGSA